MTEINSSALEKDQGFYITAHDVFQAVGNQRLLSSIFTETCLKLVHSKVDQDTDLIWFDLIWFDLIWFDFIPQTIFITKAHKPSYI